MKNDISKISWQERYHASGVYTLRCKIDDVPGMLSRLIIAIGQTRMHLGDIRIVGVESNSKIRDIQIYCFGYEHLNELLKNLKRIEGVEILSVKDDILEIHKRGVIEVKSRVPIQTVNDLRMLYTPGVASVCNKIVEEPDLAWEFTGVCDRVAVITNGTAVLGLGNIGILGALPVMEGKAAIFAEFANISAVPILVDSRDPDKVVELACMISQGFGAIQLEDISAPACFEIEEKLRNKLDIPVFHDDQHGTATVTLAAVINALKRTNRKPEDSTAVVLGAGAAGYAITKILLEFGIMDIIVYDSAGPIYKGRTHKMNPYKQKLADFTNKKNIKGDSLEGFNGRDIFIGVAQPSVVSKEMIKAMAKDPLVFPLSNPVGEISIGDAMEAGAVIAADGRAINNALAYPGLFRGALDVKAKDITMEMQIAAAYKLAELASETTLLPDMLDRNVHFQVAQAVAQAYV
jgi:malate dehydrogenase (oxaloacetate-decarboxylating)